MYSVRALPNGSCRVRGDVVFAGGSREEFYPFRLYIWLIQDSTHTIIVDTGPKDLEGFNQATSEYIPGGVVQEEDEKTLPALKKAGVSPEDVDYVIITHFHGDHCTNADLFPNAKIVVSRRGFIENLPNGIPKEIMIAAVRNWPHSLILVEDEEILPGLRVFWVGGHSICSQAIAVRTKKGVVVLSGDAAYLFKNIEEEHPIGWTDPEDSLRAIKLLKSAGDIILPGHDPEILNRFPGGVIA